MGKSQGQQGQAMVEFIIVFPVLIFLILGALQLMLIQHARIMTEYAAFAAARAGVVHSANWNAMRNAATLAALPLYGRTDTLPNLTLSWLKVEAVQQATSQSEMGVAAVQSLVTSLLGTDVSGVAPTLSLVEVYVTSPNTTTFAQSASWQQARSKDALAIDAAGPLVYPDNNKEVDFDDPDLVFQTPDAARLALQTRVLFPLQIPIVNQVIFDLYAAQVLLTAVLGGSSLADWENQTARLQSGIDLASAVATAPGPGGGLTGDAQWLLELLTLRAIGQTTGVYLLPLRASYAMHMQSNAFQDNNRAPAWFTTGANP